MIAYNSYSKVLTTPSEWEEWFQAIVVAKNASQGPNYSSCFVKVTDVEAPTSYPVFATLIFDYVWHTNATFIYPDQIRQLLGLEPLIVPAKSEPKKDDWKEEWEDRAL